MLPEREVSAKGIRFSEEMDGKEVGHAYLYLMQNDLHPVPFGFLEDVWVTEKYRNAGVARRLLQRVVERATAERCYKLIATSRNYMKNGKVDEERKKVHDWYVRLGFEKYGREFRLNLA